MSGSPLEANLGVLTVKKLENKHVADSKTVFKKPAKTSEVQTAFLASDAGKEIQGLLEVIKQETDPGKRKTQLVGLMRGFFDVSDESGDKSIQHFVVSDENSKDKQYLRINSGKASFDVSLAGNDVELLISSLIDRYLERAADVVNEGVTETKEQILLTYEEDELFIEGLKKEVKELKEEVVGSHQPPAKTGFWADVSGFFSNIGTKIRAVFSGKKDPNAAVSEIKNETAQVGLGLIAGFSSVLGTFGTLSSRFDGKKDASGTPSADPPEGSAEATSPSLVATAQGYLNRAKDRITEKLFDGSGPPPTTPPASPAMGGEGETQVG